jgi:hypothetical protein
MARDRAVSQTTTIYKKLQNPESRMQTQRPMRRPETTIVNMGTELLLRLPDGAAIHVINQTAQTIWNLCDGEHTEEEMALELRAHFRIAPGRDVEADVRRTLQAFTEQGLLVAQ